MKQYSNCCNHHNVTLLGLHYLLWGNNMSLMYLMDRVSIILVHLQSNPFLVVLGGVFLGEHVSNVLEDGSHGRKILIRLCQTCFLGAQ